MRKVTKDDLTSAGVLTRNAVRAVHRAQSKVRRLERGAKDHQLSELLGHADRAIEDAARDLDRAANAVLLAYDVLAAKMMN